MSAHADKEFYASDSGPHGSVGLSGHNTQRPVRILLAALLLAPVVSLAGPPAEGTPPQAPAASGATPAEAAHGAWPGWRGPRGDGVSEATGLPVRFDPEANGLWKIRPPGRGHSSPIVQDGRIFLSASVAGEPVPGHGPPVHMRDGAVYLHPGSTHGDRSHRLLALAYDARSGEELWRRTVHDGPVHDNRHQSNTYASPTAVTDGSRVYFWFGSEGLFAFTLDGDPVWEADLGDFGVWGLGHGISPVLHGEHIILVCDDDAGDGSVILAVDRGTGEVAWTTPRRVRKSWATPALIPVGDGVQLFVPSYNLVAGYDPETGAELWRSEGFDSNLVHTPVHQAFGDGRLVFASTGYPRKEMRALEILPDAPPRIRWRHERGTGYLPSALLYQNILFFLSDGGVITALNPDDGSVHFQARPPQPGRYHASPLGYEGQVLIASLEGDLTVFRAAPEFGIVATSSLPEAVWASPAVSGNTMFLRTVDHLYAFREAGEATTAAARPRGEPR